MANKISLDCSTSKEEVREDLEILNNFETLPKELLDEALIKEASSGDVKTVETFLNLGADVNVQNHKKQTPLHLATHREDYAIVKLLLENGAYVDAQDSYGQTALHKAFYHCETNLEMVKILLKHHANVNQQTKRLETPLHLACYYFASPSIVEILLENGASINARDERGSTPLHIAAKGFNGAADKLEILKILLKHNAEVDVRNNKDETPLHAACELGRLEIVRELLKHNPNVNAIATKYHDIELTPLMLVVDGLPHVQQQISPKEEFLEIVEELILHGANTNFRNSTYHTPLSIAIERGQVEMVNTLLKNGCNINAKAKMFDVNEDCTAFESSLYFGNTNILKMLALHES